MQGWQIQGIKETFRLVESGDGKPSPGEAVVELRAAAVYRCELDHPRALPEN